jgi:hypothetical protein
MRKCLSSFNTYITSRSTKIIDLISLLPTSSFSSYTLVHTTHQNNTGILFQLLPKIQYYLKPTTEYNSVVAVDEYVGHIISPEELRYIDYSMNMKNQRQTTNSTSSAAFSTINKPITGRNGPITPFPHAFQVLHSLPIVYPYDDSMSNMMNSI